jgi:diguanylate cyclase (GGDEF)-like protein
MGSSRTGTRAAAFRCILNLVSCFMLAGTAAAATPEIQTLDGTVADATASEVTSGSLDSHFTQASFRESAARGEIFWLRIQSDALARQARETNRGEASMGEPGTGQPKMGQPNMGEPNTNDIPVLVVHSGMLHKFQVYPAGSGRPVPTAAHIPEFGGARDLAFVLPAGHGTVYVRVEPPGAGYGIPRFWISTLSKFLGEGATVTRITTLTLGALAAMATAALLMWIVLTEKTFLLYSTFFALEALWVAYFSGQGFDWPWLSAATPLTDFTWNVLAALCGAMACLFVREIADLRHSMPRNYTVFGWLAGAFVLLTFANLIKLIGFENLVNGIGNLLFAGSAVYTLIVAFVAWRRGSRSAGWFLLAWTLLEAFTITTAVRLLLSSGRADDHDRIIYFGLPLSIVAAAILIALGIADRLRDQRRALSEAERHAQIDSLTGVLNRRSLIERLDAACLRARARGLPISLLFIDLDHFKEINDSFGHPAGDACLAAIIPPIQAELRQSDVIGRYGGEEFVVILSSADTAAAHPIAQRILERVASVRVEGFGDPIALTCSIGVATSDMLGVWGEHLIARADAAVYAAKRSGRNRVQIAVPMAA